ncbi:tetratricopeptide repeat protein (plasmid) [Acaryochloris sp. 'Moss Beach']|uniref:tetratricopeptide repeat protein n=1 Tax=Acaryochloris sp. 'Moss Beach' TaxID=2740837 RepID=UPI001F371A33|nr:tetratricopeptide repeat protein [Acaryochloris sp. 'Moss Beach']UJB73023.1 tetratricopeptide repeat protein [Acaryochloris sp. 'Moss Beach']
MNKQALNGSVGLLLLCWMGGATLLPHSVSLAQEKAAPQIAPTPEVSQDLQQGHQHLKRGESQAAQQSLKKALLHARQQGEPQGIANALLGLGTSSHALGEYAQALDYHQQSLVIFRKGNNIKGTANTLLGLGTLYQSLGDPTQAIEYYQQSLELFRKLGDQQGVAQSFDQLGRTYHSWGEYAQAIDYHQQSLVISRKISDRTGVADTLNQLGSAYDSLGEHAQALDYHQQSLQIARQIGNQKGVADAHDRMGRTYRNLGEMAQALQYHQTALEIRRKIDDRPGAAMALWGLGLTHLKQNQYGSAQTALMESIQIFEHLNRDLTLPQQRTFFQSYTRLYDDLQTVLVAQNQPLLALEIAERGRSQALNHQLAGTNPPLTIQQIKQVAKEQNATLVEYTLVSNNLLYAWVVQPDGTIHHQPIDGQQLGQSVATFEEQTRQWLENIRGVKAPNQDPAVPPLLPKVNLEDESSSSTSKQETNYTYLRQLHTLLIEPIEDYLPPRPG